MQSKILKFFVFILLLQAARLQFAAESKDAGVAGGRPILPLTEFANNISAVRSLLEKYDLGVQKIQQPTSFLGRIKKLATDWGLYRFPEYDPKALQEKVKDDFLKESVKLMQQSIVLGEHMLNGIEKLQAYTLSNGKDEDALGVDIQALTSLYELLERALQSLHDRQGGILAIDIQQARADVYISLQKVERMLAG